MPGRGSTGLRLSEFTQTSEFFSFQCQTLSDLSECFVCRSIWSNIRPNMSISALERLSNEETHCKLANSAILIFSLTKLVIHNQKLDKYAFLFYFCSKYALLSKIGFCDIWEKIHLGKASDLNINHAIKRCGAIQSDITAFTLYLAWEFFSAQYPWLAQTGRQLLR